MEERENTQQMEYDVWETDMLEYIGDSINSLVDKFDAYNHPGATVEITIVLKLPEGEEDDQSIPSLSPS